MEWWVGLIAVVKDLKI